MLEEIINLYNQNKLKEANFLCNKIVKNNLNFHELLIISTIKLKIKEFNIAIELVKKAIKLEPYNYFAYNSLAICYVETKKFNLAEQYYEKAIKLAPEDFRIYNNLALLQEKLLKRENVIKNLKKSIELNPNYSQAHTNLGKIYYENKFYKKAKFHLNIASNLDPYDYLARWNLSLIFLEQEQFLKGWHYYEYGKKCNKRLDLKFKFGETWDGKKILYDKKILVYTEQGIGDIIHFARYLNLLSKKGCYIFFQVTENLKYLFKGIAPNTKIINNKEPTPKINYYCNLMSLPYLLNQNSKNVLNKVPYIFLPEQSSKKWAKFLNFKELKIGICCNAKKNDKTFRSFGVNHLKEIYELKNLRLISLEKNSNYKSVFPNILEFKNIDKTTAFKDTAAIISNLDLVISCDTSIAHLSGALGKKTFLLLNYKSDFRWGMRKSKSLWYPSVQLFRNKKFNEWHESFKKIYNYLRINNHVNYN